MPNCLSKPRPPKPNPSTAPFTGGTIFILMTYRELLEGMTPEELDQEVQVNLSSLEEGVRPGNLQRVAKDCVWYDTDPFADVEEPHHIPKGTVLIKI